MCEIGQRIKKRRIDLGMSAEELAAVVGLSPATVYRYENGYIKKIDTNKLTPFAKALNTTEKYLMGWTDDIGDNPSAMDETKYANAPSNLTPIRPGQGQKIRIVGEIAAGKPIFMEEDFETYIDAPMKADFALTVRGDSMSPSFIDGDVVYIKEQPSVDDGQVAAVAIDDYAVLKHVYKWNGGYNLISDNPAYKPIFVNPEEQEMRILGIVVGFTRMLANQNKLAGVTKGMPKHR